MILPAILERELRLRARRPFTVGLRVIFALAAMGVLFVTTLSPFLSSSELGSAVLFRLLFLLLPLTAVMGAFLSSDLVSSEKRAGTLGLLFLTHLRPIELLIGKLVSASLSLLYALFGTFPVLGVCFLLGGVSMYWFLMAGGIWICLVVFSLGVGVLISTVSIESKKSLTATLITLFVGILGVETLVVSGYASIGLTPDNWPMPTQVAGSIKWTFFLAGFVIPLLLIGLASIGVACLLLPRMRDRNQGKLTWQEAMEIRTMHRVKGSTLSRSDRCRRILDRSPFAYLSLRRPWMATVCLVAVIGAIVVALSYVKGPSGFFLTVTIVMGILLHGLLKLWIISEALTPLSTTYHNGGLELILTTPMSVQSILRDQARALWSIFGAGVSLLVIAEISAIWFLQTHANLQESVSWFLLLLVGPILLVVDLVISVPITMAASVRYGSASHIFVRVVVSLFAPPILAVVLMLLAGGQFSANSLCFLWVLASVTVTPFLLKRSLRTLEQLRERAAGRYEF